MTENSIICGDCLEVLKDFEDNSVDLILTDPPYGINYQSAWRTDRTKWKPKIANDHKPFVEWIRPTYSIIADTGRVMCFCRWDVEDAFRYELAISGYNIKSQVIWDKIVHGMGDLNGEYAPQHENALYATKGRYEFLGVRPKTIYRYQRVMPEQLKHPNEKPISLMVQIVTDLTSPNDIILDPFCGSGTTCVAAKMLGRRYIGIEISEKYCDIARMRLEAVDTGVPVKEQLQGQMGLFNK